MCFLMSATTETTITISLHPLIFRISDRNPNIGKMTETNQTRFRSGGQASAIGQGAISMSRPAGGSGNGFVSKIVYRSSRLCPVVHFKLLSRTKQVVPILIKGEPGNQSVRFMRKGLGIKSTCRCRPGGATRIKGISTEIINVWLAQTRDLCGEWSRTKLAQIDHIVPFGVIERIDSSGDTRIFISPEDFHIRILTPGIKNAAIERGIEIGCLAGTQGTQIGRRKAGEGGKGFGWIPDQSSPTKIITTGGTEIILLPNEQPGQTASIRVSLLISTNFSGLIPGIGIIATIGGTVKCKNFHTRTVIPVTHDGSRHIRTIETNFIRIIGGNLRWSGYEHGGCPNS